MALVHILPDWLPDDARIFDCGGFLHVEFRDPNGRRCVTRMEAVQQHQVRCQDYLTGLEPPTPPASAEVTP